LRNHCPLLVGAELLLPLPPAPAAVAAAAALPTEGEAALVPLAARGVELPGASKKNCTQEGMHGFRHKLEELLHPGRQGWVTPAEQSHVQGSSGAPAVGRKDKAVSPSSS
jgi:hypothetical protein